MGDTIHADAAPARLPGRRAGRKRSMLMIRVRDAVRESIQAAAIVNQRSMSEEAERRLEAAQDIGMLVHTIEQLRVEVASLAAQVARLSA